VLGEASPGETVPAKVLEPGPHVLCRGKGAKFMRGHRCADVDGKKPGFTRVYV
jgi:hypothetical protein